MKIHFRQPPLPGAVLWYSIDETPPLKWLALQFMWAARMREFVDREKTSAPHVFKDVVFSLCSSYSEECQALYLTVLDEDHIYTAIAFAAAVMEDTDTEWLFDDEFPLYEGRRKQ